MSLSRHKLQWVFEVYVNSLTLHCVETGIEDVDSPCVCTCQVARWNAELMNMKRATKKTANKNEYIS